MPAVGIPIGSILQALRSADLWEISVVHQVGLITQEVDDNKVLGSGRTLSSWLEASLIECCGARTDSYSGAAQPLGDKGNGI